MTNLALTWGGGGVRGCRTLQPIVVVQFQHLPLGKADPPTLWPPSYNFTRRVQSMPIAHYAPARRTGPRLATVKS